MKPVKKAFRRSASQSAFCRCEVFLRNKNAPDCRNRNRRANLFFPVVRAEDYTLGSVVEAVAIGEDQAPWPLSIRSNQLIKVMRVAWTARCEIHIRCTPVVILTIDEGT